MAPIETSTSGLTNATRVNGENTHRTVPRRLYSIKSPPSLAEFQKLTSQKTDPSTYPLASTFVSNIPVYDLAAYSVDDLATTEVLQDEWHHILMSGPGVLVLKNFERNETLISQINQVFDSIIADEAAVNGEKGDHFAAAGKNSRIWNSFQKHATRGPESFVQYYSNPWLALICDTWLGPGYQVTAQVNIVRPGGQPQVSHRDYHLGFQTAEASARFPRPTHSASALLTLQGAVAHSNMPLDSGPTRFLPFSQQFEEGYMAYRLPEFIEYFNGRWVSAELAVGDGVFFNPALFHAAGENCTSDVDRSANLLQISSAFGKTMESIDNSSIILNCWDYVKQKYASEGMTKNVEAIIQAIASGYPFPSNLDKRPPAPGGMAPESEAEMLHRALTNDWTTKQVIEAIQKIEKDSLP